MKLAPSMPADVCGQLQIQKNLYMTRTVKRRTPESTASCNVPSPRMSPSPTFPDSPAPSPPSPTPHPEPGRSLARSWESECGEDVHDAWRKSGRSKPRLRMHVHGMVKAVPPFQNTRTTDFRGQPITWRTAQVHPALRPVRPAITRIVVPPVGLLSPSPRIYAARRPRCASASSHASDRQVASCAFRRQRSRLRGQT